MDRQIKSKIVNTIGQYKQKCDKLQLDMEDLRQNIKSMLTSFLGIDSAIDQQLLLLQQDLHNKENTKVAAQHVDSLVQALKELVQRTDAKDKVHQSASVAIEPLDIMINQDVNQSLSQLLEHLAIPQVLQEKLNIFKVRLSNPIASDELPALINSLTELIVEAFSLEQNQFKNLLYELTNQLHDFENYLTLSSQKNRESQQEASQLETGIQTSIAEIKQQVDQSKTIEELTAKINQNLGNIAERIKTYRANEEARANEYEEKVKTLQESLIESERGMEEVKSMLSFQQVKINQDSLTGLPNRAAYDDHLLQAYQRWQRNFGDLALGIADIDHFKTINDNYGHLAGDKVLKKVALMFKNAIRKVDFIARYGGEEFIFIFERTPEKEARSILETLRKNIEECQFFYHDKKVDVTVSFGLTSLKKGDDLETLFMRADSAMYQAKKGGRNRVEVL